MDREDIKFDLGKNRLPKIGKRYALRVVLYTVILVLLGFWYLKKSKQQTIESNPNPTEIKVLVEPSDSL